MKYAVGFSFCAVFSRLDQQHHKLTGKQQKIHRTHKETGDDFGNISHLAKDSV
jgi:hypothetical protein